MISPVLRSTLAALACATALVLASPSMAAMVNLKADLKASSEVPPNTSTGSGTLTATYDDASKKLTWKGNVSGLSGPATAAHFHAGEAGKNGAVAVPIAGADKGAFEGSATLTDAQAADMLAGKWYVNIHTAANKGGEIRGQLTK
ncbi:MAG: CHRD domain-containing protein [Rhizobiales bacterium]|nr:CHRD domain-containing protein [Hyphomicrobiales bacterium]